MDCDEADGPPCEYETVSASDGFTTLCSEEIRAVSIGFSFPFYGATYETVSVAANGLLYFSNAPACSAFTTNCSDALNQPLSGLETRAFVAVWWLDWAMDNDDPLSFICGAPGCSNSGPITIAESFRQGSGADARGMFKEIEWFSTAVHRPVCTEPNTATFKVRLYDDGQILFSYLDSMVGSPAVDHGATGTIGISSGADTEFMQISYNAPLVSSNPHAVLIRPPCADIDDDGQCATSEGGIDCDDMNSMVFDGANESCNSVDDDCDTQTDETFTQLGTVCTPGVGECQTMGVVVCDESDATRTMCSEVAGTPAMETLDGLDNDCDGEIDEQLMTDAGTPADASLDAFVMDAGANDDSSVDGATSDATFLDADLGEAGRRDGSPHDGAGPEGGQPDSSQSDGGPDSGQLDADIMASDGAVDDAAPLDAAGGMRDAEGEPTVGDAATRPDSTAMLADSAGIAPPPDTGCACNTSAPAGAAPWLAIVALGTLRHRRRRLP